MADYDNNMSGVLFKNDRKESDSHPDYKGSCEVNHSEFWISAWIKESTKTPGRKYMRLSFEPKQPRTSGGGTTQMVTPEPTPADDDIPFHHDPFEIER